MSRPGSVEHLTDSRYVRLATFRRNGDPVHTAVWHVVLDDTLYVQTGDQTGKAKRLRANGRAEITPSDARGRTTGDPTRARGASLNGDDPRRIDAAFNDKYGIQYRAVRATSGLRRNKIGEPAYFRFEIDDESSPHNGREPQETEQATNAKEETMTTEAPAAATRTVDGREVPLAGTWNLDPTHTSITFEVRHMMISKVRGSFGTAAGTIEVAEDLADSTVRVSIDIASVESGTEDRDNHLRSPDFFDAENYPQMTFRSAGVALTSEGYRLNGDLTIKDVTRPVALDFEFTGGLIDPYRNQRVAFSASTEVERDDWGLNWNMALEAGGVMVGKKIKIWIDAEAVTTL